VEGELWSCVATVENAPLDQLVITHAHHRCGLVSVSPRAYACVYACMLYVGGWVCVCVCVRTSPCPSLGLCGYPVPAGMTLSIKRVKS
jgi:hypothetical protein